IEKSVFVRLHQYGTLLPFDGEGREHQWLGGVVVPVVSWRGLIGPDLFAVANAERDDGSDVKIIALATQPVVPRRAIARAEENKVRFGIVDDGVPRSSTTSCLPPFARPRRRRPAHGLGLERFGRIAGHGIRSPDQITCLGVVCRRVAT